VIYRKLGQIGVRGARSPQSTSKSSQMRSEDGRTGRGRWGRGGLRICDKHQYMRSWVDEVGLMHSWVDEVGLSSVSDSVFASTLIP